MDNLTRIQKITISLIIAYAIWEISIWIWLNSLPEYDPIIRVDLLIIYPVLIVFIIISIFQYYKKKY
jgi:hypothetical protein